MNKRVKTFEDAMRTCVDRAEDLYRIKSETVVCSYCGKLMPKCEAGVIYDIAKNELIYHHGACFDLYEHGITEENQGIVVSGNEKGGA